MKKQSIKGRLVIVIAIAFTLLISLSSIFTIKSFKNEFKETMQVETSNKVQLLNDFIENHLKTPINLVESTASKVTKVTTEEEKVALQEQLKLIGGSVEGILGLHAAFDGDRILYSSENLQLKSDYNANTRDWYIEAKKKSGEIVITAPYVDALTGNLIFGISKTTSDGDGVVTLDVSLDFLKEILPKITIGKQGYAFVFDQQGTVLYHPSIEQGQSIMDDDMYSRFMEEQQLEYDKDGEKHFTQLSQ